MPGGDDGRFDCAEIKNGLHKLDRGARFFEYPVTKEKGRRNVIIQVNPLESKVILSIPSCLPRIPMDLSVVGVVATQTRGEGAEGNIKRERKCLTVTQNGLHVSPKSTRQSCAEEPIVLESFLVSVLECFPDNLGKNEVELGHLLVLIVVCVKLQAVS